MQNLIAFARNRSMNAIWHEIGANIITIYLHVRYDRQQYVVAGKIDSSHFNRQWPEALYAGNHAD